VKGLKYDFMLLSLFSRGGVIAVPDMRSEFPCSQFREFGLGKGAIPPFREASIAATSGPFTSFPCKFP
jgi:hypothetical protein